MDDMMKFGECLSDTLGIRILALLRHGELCFCEVKGVLGKERSKVDLRLRKLQQSGVVKTRQRGRWLAFRIHTNYTDLVETVFEAWEDETVWNSDLTQDQERLKAELHKRIEDWCANPALARRETPKASSILGSRTPGSTKALPKANKPEERFLPPFGLRLESVFSGLAGRSGRGSACSAWTTWTCPT